MPARTANPLIELMITMIIPSLILMKLSGPQNLGAVNALLLALAVAGLRWTACLPVTVWTLALLPGPRLALGGTAIEGHGFGPGLVQLGLLL